MSDDTILTQEELDFIRDLQTHSRSSDAGVPSLTLDGGPRAKKLLARLALHEQLTLEAQIDNQRVCFPLQVVEDEQHNLQLRLGPPSVVEQSSTVRPWRLHFDIPVNLLDEQDRPTTLWIHSLSLSGMLVEVHDEPAPREFALWLPLDDQPDMELQGSLVRRTGDGLYAYAVNLARPQQVERLRSFLLDRHQRLHARNESSS
ncbi:hypothetical protein D9M68_246690 [compost metagenome]